MWPQSLLKSERRSGDCTLYVDKSIIETIHGKGESGLISARRPATFNVFVSLIGAVKRLDGAGDKELYLQLTDGSYLLTGCGGPDQTGHKDL